MGVGRGVVGDSARLSVFFSFGRTRGGGGGLEFVEGFMVPFLHFWVGPLVCVRMNFSDRFGIMCVGGYFLLTCLLLTFADFSLCCPTWALILWGCLLQDATDFVHNSYGLLRSPWNVDGTPFVTRFNLTNGEVSKTL